MAILISAPRLPMLRAWVDPLAPFPDSHHVLRALIDPIRSAFSVNDSTAPASKMLACR